jgi:hypothetical protein
MIEIGPESIQPIVTIQAGSSKGDSMVKHESLIRLFVTIAANGYVKRGDIRAMTITAKERLVLSLGLMTV